MKHALHILSAVAAVILMLPACDTDTAYYHCEQTRVEGWERDDTLVFNVPKLRHDAVYGRQLSVRINSAFPFKSLVLVVEQTAEPGHRQTTDTLDCLLFDDKGRALGRGINYFQYDFTLPDTELQAEDSLNVCVRHIMRREELLGIADIGFKLTRR